jgi:outer membrane protein OmpA-like peptidoglycan-associated protein
MNILNAPRTPSILVAAAVMLALAACAAAPRQDAQLDAARSVVTAAHADPQVTGEARAELAKADAALSAGDSLLADGKSLSDVEHQAYLADRYARAAEEHGKLLASEKAVAESDIRRNVVLLRAREADVRRANAVADDRTLEATEARLDARVSARETDAATDRAEHSNLVASQARVDAAASAQEAAAATDRAEHSNLVASQARVDAAASARESAMTSERSDRLRQELSDLKATHTDRGLVVTLGDVAFATGRSDLLESSQRSIARLTAFLVEHPEHTVRVEGFTDSVGRGEFNQGLSERRAASVKVALMHGGIEPGRIRSEGYGDTFPVANNDTVAGRQQNRRVEVIISDKDQVIAQRTL